MTVVPEQDQSEVRTRAWIRSAQQGSDEALEMLMCTYKPLVRSRISDLYIPGSDYDDILQEGMIALYQAIHSFDLKSDARFAAYASVLIRNRIYDRISGAHRNRNRLLNESLPLHTLSAEPGADGSAMDSQLSGMTESLIAAELTETMIDYIQQNCSPLERAVLIRHLRHESHEAIAQTLQTNIRSVDNALYRIRQKLRRFFD